MQNTRRSFLKNIGLIPAAAVGVVALAPQARASVGQPRRITAFYQIRPGMILWLRRPGESALVEVREVRPDVRFARVYCHVTARINPSSVFAAGHLWSTPSWLFDAYTVTESVGITHL